MFECVKQVFTTLGGMLPQATPALKCNSNCCTNIKVYEPTGCCFNGDVSIVGREPCQAPLKTKHSLPLRVRIMYKIIRNRKLFST